MSIQAVGQSTETATSSSVALTLGSAPTALSSNASMPLATGSSVGGTSSYTVNISSAARAMLAEVSETSVQTAQEAGKGDRQAQRLLAKETAAKAT